MTKQNKNHSDFLISDKYKFHFHCFVVKKSGGYIIAGLLMAMGIAGPLAMKALATIAGKALIISKVALTIAGIIALKKIFSHDGDGRKSIGDVAMNLFGAESHNAAAAATTPDSNANVPYRYYAKH